MQINPLERSVKLSARELAVFRNQPLARSRSHSHSHWRANVGHQWHKRAEEEVRNTQPEARFEVNVCANWRHSGWIFNLSGRIDQLLPSENGFLIREIKTIRSPLPVADEILIEQYGDYFAQAAIYQALLRVLPEYAHHSIKSEVQFINIENGARQSVLLESSEEKFFELQLDRLIPFLNARLASMKRLRESKIRPAFSNLRQGQAELFQTLSEAALKARIVLAQAPTGFGKTGIILEHALKQMQNGVYDRCIYLSSQSTGQLETLRQLKQMIGHDLHYIQMRNRSEHRINSERHICTGDERCDTETGQRWRESNIHPSELFIDGTLSLAHAQELGAETGICPYTLTKACLPFAEIWIGDSNYIFSPESRPIFLDAPGFEAERTLIIIDEAHNLPKRAADCLSTEIASSDLFFAIEELRAHGAPSHLLSIASELARWIADLDPEKVLNSHERYIGQDLCEDFTEELKQATFNYEEAAPFAIQLAWSIPTLAISFSALDGQYLHWVPRAGVLAATCLDASAWIKDCLEPFGGAIMMSATLAPFDTFEKSCGLNSDLITIAQGHAPWRENAYNVAIDCRVDTRLKSRSKHYETTARTVALLSHFSPGVPVAVFFSSYQYADNVLAYLEAARPELRVMRQPRGVNLSEQKDFIERGLLTADALFLVLGSSYAEGIDLMGGRIDQIMIVGPALPEVNLVQKTKMAQSTEDSQEDAFTQTYIRPAMRRIHQALGRIVRAPGQSARVLLHGKRFSESAYQSELAPEYHTDLRIDKEEALLNWLES